LIMERYEHCDLVENPELYPQIPIQDPPVAPEPSELPDPQLAARGVAGFGSTGV